MKSQFSFALFLSVLVVGALSRRTPPLRHGSTYLFKNIGSNLVLTANKHLFVHNKGLRVGTVRTEEYTSLLTQHWDAMITKDEENSDYEYWLVAEQYTLNEINAVQGVSPYPPKNLLIFIPIDGASNTYLIRSTYLNRCVQLQGPSQPILYAPCDPNTRFQQWIPEYVKEAGFVDTY